MEKDKKSGKLYICATPIGNLMDISLRAIETLKSVDLIAAEDTRNSIKLLNHFDIRTPMTSYHEHNRFKKAEELVKKMQMGMDVALITDAGTPCISDPGEVLIQKCIESQIEITSIPGPSAVITALILSGFDTARFVFYGFLPPRAKKKARTEAIESLKDETSTIVLYEAPHHLKDTLRELKEALGPQRRVALCKEMTKVHEQVIRTTLSEALNHEPKGEYVIVIEGIGREEIARRRVAAFLSMTLDEHMKYYISLGLSEKEAMKKVAADRGMSRRDIYNELKK